MYGFDNLIKDLKSGRDWNEIREAAKAAALDPRELSKEKKKELSEVMNQYFYDQCPQEYKDNPDIHYEVNYKK